MRAPPVLSINPESSFTLFPLAPHVAGGGNLLVVGRARRFEDVARYSFRVLAWRFDRATIRGRDLAPFLEFFDVARIERAGLLGGLYNRVLFDFVGYESESFNVHERGETRGFLRKLAEQWPYLFYAQHLPGPGTFLRAVAFSIVRRRRESDGPSVPKEFHRQWVTQLMLPCEPLFARLALTPAQQNERALLLFDSLGAPTASVPDATIDPNRAAIVAQAEPGFSLVACLESICRQLGWRLTQRQLWNSATSGTPADAKPHVSIEPLLRELGFAHRQVCLAAVMPEHRVTAFRQTLARFLGAHFLLFAGDPEQEDAGEMDGGWVRLMAASPVLRIMNPDGGKIETWTDTDIRQRVCAACVIMPLDYAQQYPEGCPAPDPSFNQPVETKLPEPVVAIPDEAKPGLLAQMRAAVPAAPEEPWINPLTGLAVPSFGELLEVVLQENILQEVDRLLRDTAAPIVRQTYDRLVLEGRHPDTAREWLVRIYAACLSPAPVSRAAVDLDRYQRELATLIGGIGEE